VTGSIHDEAEAEAEALAGPHRLHLIVRDQADVI
jgi:hypothetical protein